MQDNDDRDEIEWILEPSVMFFVVTAYALLGSIVTNVQVPIWRNLWKIKIPSKIKPLLWVMLHDRIMGNAKRKLEVSP